MGRAKAATYNQIHPTQPQVGYREVARKLKDYFLSRLNKNEHKFSRDLYEFCYTNSLAPAYVASTPATDSRHGVEPVLAYITDRTHGSTAMADLIVKTYGEDALSKPIYDQDGRGQEIALVRLNNFSSIRFNYP